MKKINLGGLFIGTILFITILTSCGKKQEMKLVNEQRFQPAQVSGIRLDYDNDDITLLESPTADIVLKEYMDIDKSAYYARIENRNGVLSVSEGQRPGGGRLDCYVELYLPAGYEADVTVHTTESTLKTKVSHTLASLRTETTHGILEITDINVRTISVSSAGGDISLSNVKTDMISIFHFIAESRNGSISTGYDGVAVKDGQAAGDVGSNPQFTVALETRNGNVEAK